MDHAQTRSPKPKLAPQELQEAIDLSLWLGQLLLQYGADAHRIEETVHRFGTALGCDWLDVLVNHNGLVITTVSGSQFRTRVRRVVELSVDIAVVSEINQLSRRMERQELTRTEAWQELERLSRLHPVYPRWVVAPLIGLACAGFSQLFGGDWPAFFVTLCASTTAAVVHQALEKRHINALLMTCATAFIAAILASSAAVFNWGNTPETALAAAVLLLVPGVPLINGVEDLIQGHLGIGLARASFGVLISLGIALGLWLAILLTGARVL